MAVVTPAGIARLASLPALEVAHAARPPAPRSRGPGADRIGGELVELGIVVSNRSVPRYAADSSAKPEALH
jgi:hypothetical protein